MQFVWIPPSGERWKAECIRRGLGQAPVNGFYLQARELSLNKYRELGGSVGGLSTFENIDWELAATIPDWVSAVNISHRMTVDDPDFSYRLPTVSEWLYAQWSCDHLLANHRQVGSIQGMHDGSLEFATDSILDMSFPIGYDASHEPETARRSFVMNRRLRPNEDPDQIETAAYRTPPTGDDGIDELTEVRFVLTPEEQHPTADSP